MLSFIRRDASGSPIVCAMNFSGGPHEGYVLGVPSAGEWKEVLNTDAASYGGSGVGNQGTLTATDDGLDGQPAALTVTLPPLGAAFFMPAADAPQLSAPDAAAEPVATSVSEAAEKSAPAKTAAKAAPKSAKKPVKKPAK